MKKILLLLLCSPIVVLAAGTTSPAKAVVAPVATKAETLKKVEEKKVEETSMIEDLKLLYKSTEAARTKIKNHAVAQYNIITNSDTFQLGKCAVGGLLVYYGTKQLQSFTTTKVNGGLGEIAINNPFAEDRPKVIYQFLRNRDNFKIWLKDPVTKAGMKIVVGAFLVKKPIMSLAAAYDKAVKKFL